MYVKERFIADLMCTLCERRGKHSKGALCASRDSFRCLLRSTGHRSCVQSQGLHITLSSGVATFRPRKRAARVSCTCVLPETLWGASAGDLGPPCRFTKLDSAMVFAPLLTASTLVRAFVAPAFLQVVLDVVLLVSATCRHDWLQSEGGSRWSARSTLLSG